MNSSQPTRLRIAIVGASTLKGQEIKSVLRERQFPVMRVTLLDGDDDLGRVSEFDGEPSISLAIEPGNFDFLDVVFFASNAEVSRTFGPLAAKNGFLLIDLAHGFQSEVGVPCYLDGLWKQKNLTPDKGRISSPHPAGIAVASVLRRLNDSYDVRNCVVSIFEPASERGSGGVEELKQQTLDIFSFRRSERPVFDSQLTFNLLARLGAGAREALSESEKVVAAQLKSMLAPDCPLPRISLIQAPVFHSHAFSFFVEVDARIPISDLEECLESDSITVIAAADDPPSPVQVAGSDQIQVGGMKRDLLCPNGLWFWAAADNLRLSAVNAVSAAETILLHKS